MTTVGSLCTGYGGIEMGLRLAGLNIDVAWIAETESALDPLHGQVHNLGDITQIDWSGVERVELITAGFPCQPTSAAGRQLGDADPRWLWPHVRCAIAALMPRQVLIENVRNLVSYGKGRLWTEILTGLNGLGYDVRWLTLGACHVGAAHHRHRVFALATHKLHRISAARVERVHTSFCGTRAGASTTLGGERGRQGDVGSFAGIGQLLPTPQARDGDGRGDAELGASYHNNRGEPGSIVSATQPQHWGRFTAAVNRHADLYGAPPAPTEPNRNDAPRLAPAFAEWLMCLPAGHVTGKLDRVPALRAIGNGVCPPQLAAAWRLLS